MSIVAAQVRRINNKNKKKKNIVFNQTDAFPNQLFSPCLDNWSVSLKVREKEKTSEEKPKQEEAEEAIPVWATK